MTRHLIHIGFPKAGSTYLQEWFELHPGLQYMPGGIAGFASVHKLADSMREHSGQPDWVVTSSEALCSPLPRHEGSQLIRSIGKLGDLSEYSRRSCRSLAALFPDATILIVTRGFSAMILSSYSQHVRTGSSLGFAEVLQNSSSDHPWDYDTITAMYREAFDDRVIVMPYELLRDDPVTFRRLIENRLGIASFEFPERRSNPSLTGAELAWYPRFSRLVGRLPLPQAVRSIYNRAIFSGRLRHLAVLLDGLSRGERPDPAAIPQSLLRYLSGCARSLAGDPLYAPYAAEYWEAGQA